MPRGEGEKMMLSNRAFPFFDNGGCRSGIERREFTYTLHIPERREGKDRRSWGDRRKLPDPGDSPKRIAGKERRATLFE
jgi:hypothetical protein